MEDGGKVNGLPYYKAYPRDFLDGTVGMPLELKGAYRIILDLIYMHGGKLPDDKRYICGHLGCNAWRWNKIRKALLESGKIQILDHFLTNSRAFLELKDTEKFQRKQAENASGPRKNKGLEKPRQNHTESESDTDKKNPPKPPKGGVSLKDKFAEFWDAYPRKESKQGAERKFATAVKSGVPPDLIISGAKTYAEHLSRERTERKFVKLPTTWLNQGCWDDQLAPDHSAAVTMTKEGSLEARLATARAWISKHDSVPSWMDKDDTARALIEEGYDYDDLRRRGFSLPPRGNVVDIGGVANALGRSKTVGGDS